MLQNATLSLYVLFVGFFVVVVCCCFSPKNLCFYHFSFSFFFLFFFDKLSNLCHRILTNQKPKKESLAQWQRCFPVNFAIFPRIKSYVR